MEKELIFPISIIVLMLLCIGITVSVDFFNHENEVMLETFYFPIPEGYTEGKMNEFGAMNYTDGNTSIFLLQYDDLDVESKINNYTDILERSNKEFALDNYTVNGNVIYKLVNNNNTNIIHYWFVKNNNSYDIYTWDGNKDIETVVNNFVSN